MDLQILRKIEEQNKKSSARLSSDERTFSSLALSDLNIEKKMQYDKCDLVIELFEYIRVYCIRVYGMQYNVYILYVFMTVTTDRTQNLTI